MGQTSRGWIEHFVPLFHRNSLGSFFLTFPLRCQWICSALLLTAWMVRPRQVYVTLYPNARHLGRAHATWGWAHRGQPPDHFPLDFYNGTLALFGVARYPTNRLYSFSCAANYGHVTMFWTSDNISRRRLKGSLGSHFSYYSMTENNIFSFLFLAMLGLCSCSAWVSHCGGFSSCWAQALGVGRSSHGSGVVVHRLSCSEGRGIFPGQGLNPCLLHW